VSRLSFFCEGHPSLEEYMSLASFSRVAVLSSIVAVGFVGVGAVSASAASSCPTGAIPISPTICQVTFTEGRDFTVPAGVTKLTAVLVGGGGGSYVDPRDPELRAAGGAGGVKYVDNVALTGKPIVVTIGAGGDVGGDGEQTFVGTDRAGKGLRGGELVGGTSGSTNPGNERSGTSPYNWAAGGGAQTAAIAGSSAGGLGYLFSEIPGIDADLWPAASNLATAVGTGGAGYQLTPATQNYGDGGSVLGEESGKSGVVIFRFAAMPDVTPTPDVTPAPPAAEIANTGVATTGGLLLPIALIVAGASFVALRSKKLFTLKKS
jgi:hypothetical protein